MSISLICATSANGVIGANNRLPWKLPADLKRFKEMTLSHPVVMGRKTYESIGRALPGRKNVVITRQKNFQAKDCLIAGSLSEGLQLCSEAPEIFVIGGASIYQQTLPMAHKIYLTQIHEEFEGDTLLFDLDKELWQETSRKDCQADADNPYPYSFLTFEKKNAENPV